MWQWFRKLGNFVLRFFKRLLGIKVDFAPSTPTAPAKVEAPATRPGLGEPELPLASTAPPQYRKRESLFTYREREFYKALMEEVGNEYQVFAKVRLGDFVFLANEPADKKYHRNQIQCKHVDFLLCNKVSHQPLMAIELDDSSHDKYDRRESDQFKSRLFSEVGLRLLRIQVQQSYPKGEIGKQVRSKMQEAQSAADR